MNIGIFGANGEDAAVLGIVTDPVDCVGTVSSRVIVNPDGNLPDPLGFRLLVAGPDGPLGDAGRDRFLGVKVAEVFAEKVVGIAKGVLFGIVNCPLKLCCNLVRSGVE